MNSRKAPVILLSAMTILFFLEEAVVSFLPGSRLPLALLKGLTSLCPALLCLLGTLRSPSRLHIGLSLALLLCLIGDIAINLSMLAGMVLFALAHVMLCAVFFHAQPPVRWQLALWIGLDALFIALAFAFRSRAGALLLPAMGYIFVLCAMLTLALRQRPLLAVGAFVFALSDFLLARNAVMTRTPLTHLISLGVYYVAVGLIAMAPWHAAPGQQPRA